MSEKMSDAEALVAFIERKFQSAFKNEQIKTNPEEILSDKKFILIDGYSQDYEDPIKVTRAVEAILTLKLKGIDNIDQDIIVASTSYKQGIGEATELAVERINQRSNENGKKIEYITVDADTGMKLLETSNKKENALHVTFGGGEEALSRLKVSEILGIPKEVYPKFELDPQVAMFSHLENKEFDANPVLTEEISNEKVTSISKKRKITP
jgi:hypothetical protein